jgi:hypothetical protein
MAVFKTGTAVTTTTPTVVVDVTAAAPLPPGTHRFQLQVVDDDGNISDPVFADVIVKDTQKPIAVISAPAQVQPGQSFTLDGSKSSDAAPGKVAQWIWTMLS